MDALAVVTPLVHPPPGCSTYLPPKKRWATYRVRYDFHHTFQRAVPPPFAPRPARRRGTPCSAVLRRAAPRAVGARQTPPPAGPTPGAFPPACCACLPPWLHPELPQRVQTACCIWPAPGAPHAGAAQLAQTCGRGMWWAHARTLRAQNTQPTGVNSKPGLLQVCAAAEYMAEQGRAATARTAWQRGAPSALVPLPRPTSAG